MRSNPEKAAPLRLFRGGPEFPGFRVGAGWGFPGELAGEAMVSRSDLIAMHCSAGNFLGAL